MKRSFRAFAWLFALLLVLPPGLHAPVAYAAVTDPPPVADGWVEVSTAEQLLYISGHQADYLAAQIRLMNDIALTGVDNWRPLGGNGHAPFSGTFDGGGHRVTGISIVDDAADDGDNYDYAGFFGESTGIVKNVGVSVDIHAGIYAGGLIGLQEGGSVDRSFSTGTVRAKPPSGKLSVAGGLIGSANANITRSYSIASAFSASTPNQYAAGLIGSKGVGRVEDAYARGTATFESDYHTVYSGGFAGFLITGSIVRGYTTWDVSSEQVSYVKRFLGFQADSGAVSGSYFLIPSSEHTEGGASGAVGLSDASMKEASSYSGWDFTNRWAIHSNVNDGYPYLRHEIVTEALPAAMKDEPYAFTLGAFAGADVELDWSAAGLPGGLTLSESGKLEGTPTESGTFDIVVTAVDAGNLTAQKTFELIVFAYAPEPADFAIEPGTAYGTAKVSATLGSSGHAFYYTLTDSIDARPQIGDSLPAGAIAYTPGDDIGAVSVGRYLTLYEAGAAGIQAWRSVLLDASHIQSSVGAVTGSVYNASGDPLAGAIVSIDTAQATTDAEGGFTLANVAQGAKTLRAEASGYIAKEAAVTVIAGTSIDVGEIALTAVGSGSGDYSPIVTLPVPDKLRVDWNGETLELSFKKETAPDGRSVLRLIADASAVSTLFDSRDLAILTVDNEDPVVKLDLPAAALRDVQQNRPEAELELKINGASYRLPLRYWPALPENGVVTIAISASSEADASAVKDALAGQGLEMLAAPVEFAIYLNGQEQTEPGGAYTKRTIALSGETDPYTATVIRLSGEGSPRSMPSVFQTAANGDSEAAFYAMHNSLYTVIRSERSFSDVQGHWAKPDIERLASKLIVDGKSDKTFDPEGLVTRAEFAALLTRSLGIADTSGGAGFADVTPDVWYAGAAGAALDAGLVTGYEDGTFRPNEAITREQMAVMIDRAIAFAGESPTEAAAFAAAFEDAEAISGWARPAVGRLLELHVILGVSENSFAPEAAATRAQCVVMLRHMLEHLSFINE
ncbi:S-layer homology domain-containing protein [Paenibacillus sp. MBLB2552]|uniref:S-layer homology domain-containing protein n=1 Tax=Paenibacillus mellifer TaxID=2937794 RepID=A0A9X1XXB2_9BACL|nr:S-layer homology domain-containing protein [Paenibacillus mellifer]MCK8487029.1 S-layer homology domain-containing protein [Paenibacillus mellifer]